MKIFKITFNVLAIAGALLATFFVFALIIFLYNDYQESRNFNKVAGQRCNNYNIEQLNNIISTHYQDFTSYLSCNTLYINVNNQNLDDAISFNILLPLDYQIIINNQDEVIFITVIDNQLSYISSKIAN